LNLKDVENMCDNHFSENVFIQILKAEIECVDSQVERLMGKEEQDKAKKDCKNCFYCK
jgi:hypothetical protein